MPSLVLTKAMKVLKAVTDVNVVSIEFSGVMHFLKSVPIRFLKAISFLSQYVSVLLIGFWALIQIASMFPKVMNPFLMLWLLLMHFLSVTSLAQASLVLIGFAQMMDPLLVCSSGCIHQLCFCEMSHLLPI